MRGSSPPTAFKILTATLNKISLKMKHKKDLVFDFDGPVAQLVEHLICTQDVRGSMPLSVHSDSHSNKNNFFKSKIKKQTNLVLVL